MAGLQEMGIEFGFSRAMIERLLNNSDNLPDWIIKSLQVALAKDPAGEISSITCCLGPAEEVITVLEDAGYSTKEFIKN